MSSPSVRRAARPRRPLREVVGRLARESREGYVDVAIAARALGATPRAAALRLGALDRAGWLARVRRGLYVIRPLTAGADRAPPVVEDPWVLADQVFAPCYIGGWSAAEHWALTEQVFRAVFVVTAASARRRTVEVARVPFVLARVPRARVALGTPVWRGATQVAVSSPELTLVDGAANPAWVGGVRHLAEMLARYRASARWAPEALGKALRALDRGAAWKRLGYLLEALGLDARSLVTACHAARPAGVIALDPTVRAPGPIDSRWGLRRNVAIDAGTPA